MTTNNDILCRWRDALDNPPVGRRVPVLLTDDRISADRPYDIGDGFPRWNDRVVQWLDITAIPGVPREAVQAAIKRIKDCQEVAHGNDEYVAFGTAVDVIEEYTEVTNEQ